MIKWRTFERVNTLMQLTLFTPKHIPTSGIHLMQESVILSLFRKNKVTEDIHSDYAIENKDDAEAKNQNATGSMLDIFKEIKVYGILLASSAWELRRTTHQSWLAAGWPQWVAAGDDNIESGDQFDYDINRFQSIAFFCLIGANLVPGILIDAMNKRLTR